MRIQSINQIPPCGTWTRWKGVEEFSKTFPNGKIFQETQEEAMQLIMAKEEHKLPPPYFRDDIASKLAGNENLKLNFTM